MTSDPLAQAVRRWRKPAPQASHELHELAQRLDDKGCAYGRVTSARLDDLVRASERLEAKLNAVLLAVTSTFISTLIGLVIFYLRQ
ncbi:MAG: hypothetical protein HY690_05095 [Chloroflexi bacterium]|nr:hypothetical protein [Chloroflexota bacterium]